MVINHSYLPIVGQWKVSHRSTTINQQSSIHIIVHHFFSDGRTTPTHQVVDIHRLVGSISHLCHIYVWWWSTSCCTTTRGWISVVDVGRCMVLCYDPHWQHPGQRGRKICHHQRTVHPPPERMVHPWGWLPVNCSLNRWLNGWQNVSWISSWFTLIDCWSKAGNKLNDDVLIEREDMWRSWLVDVRRLLGCSPYLATGFDRGCRGHLTSLFTIGISSSPTQLPKLSPYHINEE